MNRYIIMLSCGPWCHTAYSSGHLVHKRRFFGAARGRVTGTRTCCSPFPLKVPSLPFPSGYERFPRTCLERRLHYFQFCHHTPSSTAVTFSFILYISREYNMYFLQNVSFRYRENSLPLRRRYPVYNFALIICVLFIPRLCVCFRHFRKDWTEERKLI